MKAALRHIEKRLRELADGAEQSTPATRGEVEVLTHELRILATMSGAQAEMIEQGLAGEP